MNPVFRTSRVNGLTVSYPASVPDPYCAEVTCGPAVATPLPVPEQPLEQPLEQPPEQAES